MEALTRAIAASERSFLNAKASSVAISNELLARGPQGGLIQRSDFAKSSEQLRYYRGWVYASIRPIAQKIAGQPIRAARGVRHRKSTKHMAELRELESHPILDLLSNPSDLMTAWSLMYVTVASLELTGRSLWWVPQIQERRQVFTIPTSWIVTIEGSSSYQRFLIRPPNHTGEPIALPADEVAYFHYPHPGDPHGACSPLQAAGLAVMADESIQASQRAAFGQGINPRHALIVGKARGPDGNALDRRPKLSGQQRRQLIKAIRDVYSGVHAHGEPLILDGLIEDIKKLSNTPSEMDWMDSARQQKERITQTFGTNPIILGQIEGANRASSLAAEEHFAEFTVNPKIELLSQSLTGWLAPMFGEEGLQLWIEPVVPADAEMELRKMELLAKSSSLTVNELRSWAGLAETEFGDIPVGLAESVDDELSRQVRQLLGAQA